MVKMTKRIKLPDSIYNELVDICDKIKIDWFIEYKNRKTIDIYDAKCLLSEILCYSKNVEKIEISAELNQWLLQI